MNRTIYQLIISVLLGTIVISCQDNRGKKNVKIAGSEPQAKEVVNSQLMQPTEKEHPGKAVYAQYCLVCHQTNGSGVPGMYPPLSKGSWTGKDPQKLVSILTKGLSGEVEVNGEIYKSAMPAQAQLTDQEIADVLSYIRSNFGNSFDPVDAVLVNKIRNAK